MPSVSRVFSFRNTDRASKLASHVELAGTSKERRRGLMGVSTLEGRPGLWIVPCEAIHTFGMKMAIDSIFLDKQLRVKKVRSGLRPGRISVCVTAHSVLELPVGSIANSGTRPGDCLECVEIGG